MMPTTMIPTATRSDPWRLRALPTVVSGLALLSLATPTFGQGKPGSLLYDRVQLTASGAIVLFDSNLRVDGESGQIGTDINTENVLGLSRTKLQPRLGIRWRPGRRHELELGYQFARRSGEKVLSEEISFADTSFTVGADVRSELTSDNLFLTYRFAVGARERSQFGLGVGLGLLLQDAMLEALGSLEADGDVRTIEYAASESLPAPTASLGLYGRFQLGDRFVLEPDLRGIIVTFDRYDVRTLEGGVGARYFLSGTVGFEAGWSLQYIRVVVEPVRGGDSIEDVGGRLQYGTQTVRAGMILAPWR